MSSIPPGVDLCTIPAGRAPEGQKSNLVNPVTLAPVTISIVSILTAWAFTFAMARFYVNRQKFKLADYFMAAGLVLSITYSGLIISLNRYNRHMWDVPVCWLTPSYLKIIFAHTTIVGSVLFFPKCAILLMYRDLFEIRTIMRIAIWSGLIFTFAIYFPSIPLSAIYEAPRAGHSWEELLLSLATKGESDHTLVYWGIVQGASSVFLDLYIFILPLPLLSRIRMPLKNKLQLTAVFGTAVFGVVASVIALVFRVKLLHTNDSTWESARLAITVVVENTVAIVVGCMPAVAKFFRLYIADLPPIRSLRTKIWGSSSGGSSHTAAVPPAQGTFGSPTKPKKALHHYYELTESMLTRTQVTVPPNENTQSTIAGDTGIMRTISVSQQSGHENSTQSVEKLL